MSDDFRIKLFANEDALILTANARCYKVCAHDMPEFLKNADKVNEMMIALMKHNDARNGIWAWKVQENYNAIAGWEIRDDEINDLLKL